MAETQLARAESAALADRLDADALADAAAAQPDLFRGLGAPVAVVRAARSYAHTGKAITSDEARVGRIAVLAAGGWSVRSICRQTGESRNTVSAAVAELEKLGKLEPYREAVGRRLAELVADQMEVVGELLAREGRDADQVADLKAGWVGVGVGLTHMGAARPARVEHLHLHQVAGPSPARSYLEALAAAAMPAAGPSATQADASESKPLTINAAAAGDAAGDATGPAGDLGNLGLTAGPDAPADPTPAARPPAARPPARPRAARTPAAATPGGGAARARGAGGV